MSRNPDIAPACIGKLRYETFGHAKRVARKVRQRDDKAFVHAYHCPHCQQFHIGENNDLQKSRRRRREKGREA